MPSADSERRSLEELRTLYELYPETRDVFVEGRYDGRMIAAYFRYISCIAKVYAVDDRVNVEGKDVISMGQDIGARGRLIFLAGELESWPAETKSCGTCIIDADRSHLTHDLPDFSTLLVTDYGSMELYALSPTTIDKFFSVVLRMDLEVSAQELINRLLSPLTQIFAVRHVLHENNTGATLPKNFAASCDFRQNHIQVDVRGLLRRSLNHLPARVLDELAGEVAAVVDSLPNNRRRFVRGHDIAPLLIKMFHLRNDWAHPDTVEHSLMGCVEWSELHTQGMFIKLRGRVCSTSEAPASTQMHKPAVPE
jgi:hypothetical protein